MSTKAPGEILELFRGGYLSMAETIDALDAVEGYVSVELLNIERAISDDLREQNAKLREAAATPAVGGEDQFHPGKCLPDCMMPDGGECCPGYVALYDAYWHLVRAAPPASPLRGREALADLVDAIECELDIEYRSFAFRKRFAAAKAALASPQEQPAADPDKETQE